MATKTLTITEDAYNLLAARKQPLESFSDVINRLARRRSLTELRGLITSKEGAALKRHHTDLNKRLRREMDDRRYMPRD